MFSRRGLIALLLVVASLSVVVPASAVAQPPTRPADEGFVPIDELPPGETLPAAPFLIAAYAIAWVAVLAYLFSIRQRLGRVEREIADVTRRVQQRSGG